MPNKFNVEVINIKRGIKIHHINITINVVFYF